MGIVSLCQCLFGILLAWFFFNLMGDRLLAMPSAFHEATLWRKAWFNDQ
jgi:hypothetical protein